MYEKFIAYPHRGGQETSSRSSGTASGCPAASCDSFDFVCVFAHTQQVNFVINCNSLEGASRDSAGGSSTTPEWTRFLAFSCCLFPELNQQQGCSACFCAFLSQEDAFAADCLLFSTTAVARQNKISESFGDNLRARMKWLIAS